MISKMFSDMACLDLSAPAFEETRLLMNLDQYAGWIIFGAQSCFTMSALGPMENGKYLEIRYRYDTEIDGKDCTEEVISGYTAFVAEQDFSVQEITSADEYCCFKCEASSQQE